MRSYYGTFRCEGGYEGRLVAGLLGEFRGSRYSTNRGKALGEMRGCSGRIAVIVETVEGTLWGETWRVLTELEGWWYVQWRKFYVLNGEKKAHLSTLTLGGGFLQAHIFLFVDTRVCRPLIAPALPLAYVQMRPCES